MAHPRTYDSRWWIVGGVFVFGFLLYILQRILLPFAVALLLAYIVLPFVNWLERRLRWPRVLLLLVLFLAAALPSGVVGSIYAPRMANFSEHLLGDLPAIVQTLARRILRGDQLTVMGHTITVESLSHALSTSANGVLSDPKNDVLILGWSLQAAVGIVLVFVLLFYLLLSIRSFGDAILALAPPGRSPRLQYFAPRIDALVGRYLRGVFLVVLFQGLAAYVGFRWVAGLAYALPAAVVTAVLEPLPGIGPILAVILVGGTVVLLEGFVAMVKVLAVLVFLRLTLDNIVGPVLLGWALRLHPVIIIFVFLVSGSLFGVVGLLVALPATATVRLLLREWDGALRPEDGPDIPDYPARGDWRGGTG
jgi:predicted PurR-regulated permease PerM